MLGFYIGLVFITIIGFVVGSFVSCVSYRLPNGLTFLKGRSICPHCRHEIAWYDNIPLLSYLLLRGKCRSCKKKISFRYPLIELSLAILFVIAYLLFRNCHLGYYFCQWRGGLGDLTLVFLVSNLALIMTILIIDLENTVIPDEVVFVGFVVALLVFMLIGQDLYDRLAASFLAAAFLLFLNLATRGRGMGLGDVKFALYGGLFFKLPMMISWLFGAFVIGAGVGLLLILLGKARFGSKIAFGPFLALSLIFALFFGESLKILPI